MHRNVVFATDFIDSDISVGEPFRLRLAGLTEASYYTTADICHIQATLADAIRFDVRKSSQLSSPPLQTMKL